MIASKPDSPFGVARASYRPRIPDLLEAPSGFSLHTGAAFETARPEAERAALRAAFPNTYGRPLVHFAPASLGGETPKPCAVGVVLSGGPSPGGHNVLWGLAEGLAALPQGSRLVGFMGGPKGLLEDRATDLDLTNLAAFRNSGGFDCLGTGRNKLETPEQMARCQATLERHGLDALVVIGGDDSNTNAAQLAEYFAAQGSKLAVIGVPKTIDGDLMNTWVETSFGFDTAARVYAELIANVARDAASTRKYYHFIRLMGRSASHITLEAALQTQPNVALIAEEIAHRQLSMQQLILELGELVKERAATGRNFGVILVPEGLIEFLPEFKKLIIELNQLLADHKDYMVSLQGFTAQSEYVHRKLSVASSHTFASLPIDIQRQLLMERDPHGNVVVSQIETEKLLIALLDAHLREEKAEGRFAGTFAWQRHFFGYEGRCAAPTNFDADYAYALGRVALALASHRQNGYMAVVRRLTKDHASWEPAGVPLTAMMTIEKRKGRPTPVIQKAMVSLDGAAFRHFAGVRSQWRLKESYRYAGPIQYFGPPELVDRIPLTVALERGQQPGDVNW